MRAQERLAAFKQALTLASAEFGVRLAIVQQIGAVVLDEPTLGYILMDDMAELTKESRVELPLPAYGAGAGGEADA
jgi:hypothetical protein